MVPEERGGGEQREDEYVEWGDVLTSFAGLAMSLKGTGMSLMLEDRGIEG